MRARFADGLERLSGTGIAAVLLNLSLLDSRGIATVDRLSQAAPHVPILVIDSPDDENAGRRGALRSDRPSEGFGPLRRMRTEAASIGSGFRKAACRSARPRLVADTHLLGVHGAEDDIVAATRILTRIDAAEVVEQATGDAAQACPSVAA